MLHYGCAAPIIAPNSKNREKNTSYFNYMVRKNLSAAIYTEVTFIRFVHINVLAVWLQHSTKQSVKKV